MGGGTTCWVVLPGREGLQDWLGQSMRAAYWGTVECRQGGSGRRAPPSSAKCIQGDAVRERTRETSGARHSRIRAQSAFREMQSGRYSQGEDSGKRLARALRHVCQGEMRTAPCELTSTMMTRSAIHLLCSTSPDSDACCPWHPTWLPLLALL